ncbi:MAG: DNA polymerase IV [Chloroflexi bacterium HGW-Chloroflexi-4]|nr:MAG: DNA polymerase IV [Chloroflexi bacterium HGW-Chloroflexi-4]
MSTIRYRKILHLDLDAFFCAVEELKDPSLAGKAFAVGGRADHRGVISTCSYAARQFGVHSAMPTGQALKLCPDLMLISGRHGEYGEKSREVMEIVHQLTGLVEQVSVDEAFMDVTDLPDEGETLARKLQADVLQKTGLPCSIGVASNKLVAKVATDTGKARNRGNGYPRAILVVPNGREAEFLAPLPVKAMWGVGPKMEKALHDAGIRLLGDIPKRSRAEMERLFGKYGYELYDHALGIDDRPISMEREAKSISQETTFAKDSTDPVYLRQTLKDLSAHVGYQLRQEGFCAKVVRLKIRWSDFSTQTRQTSLPQPTDQDGVIYSTIETLFRSIWESGKPVRLIGVGCADLVETLHQMSLWETPTDKERRLLDALDDLRERYGKGAIKRGHKLGR